MNLAADKTPPINHPKTPGLDSYQTPWISPLLGKGKKLYLIRSQDGTVKATVVAQSLQQRLLGVLKPKQTPTIQEIPLEERQHILEERVFFDVKEPRFQKEKLLLQKLVREHASIQTLLDQLDRDFKNPSLLPQSDAEKGKTSSTNYNEKLKGLHADLEKLCAMIEDQNKSQELKAYETLQASVKKIEECVYDAFVDIAALQSRLANSNLSSEELNRTTKDFERNHTAWNDELAAINRLFNEDKAIRQTLLDFENDLVPFPADIKENWIKLKKDWLIEFPPKKLSLSSDMEIRKQRAKEMCAAISQQCREEMTKAIASAKEHLKQNLPISPAGSLTQKQQPLNNFKKTALALRLQTWEQLETALSGFSLNEISACQSQINQEKNHDLVVITWLNHKPSGPGYMERFISSITHPLQTLAYFAPQQTPTPSILIDKENIDEIALAYIHPLLDAIQQIEQELKTSTDPDLSKKKLDTEYILEFILNTRRFHAENIVDNLKKNHPKLFGPDTHHALLTAAQATAQQMISNLTAGMPANGSAAWEWENARLAVKKNLETLHHLEILHKHHGEYTQTVQMTQKRLSALTGQEKQDATEIVEALTQSLASLDIGVPLKNITKKTLNAYAQNFSRLISHVEEIFKHEQQKIAIKAEVYKEIDHAIQFFDSLLTQVGEIERFFFRSLPSIKEQIEQKKAAILQLKTKNTLNSPRWLWFFPFPNLQNKDNVEEFSIDALMDYLESVKKEISTQTQNVLTLHISPLANAIKLLQKHQIELESETQHLTSAFKQDSRTGTLQIPPSLSEKDLPKLQLLRATQHQETLRSLRDEELRKKVPLKNLKEARAIISNDIEFVKSLLESSKKSKALSLLNQIAQLNEHPTEQRLAKLAFFEMLTTKMNSHTDSMNEKVRELAKTPKIYEEAIYFVHETKGELLGRLESLPEAIQKHSADWLPIANRNKFTPPTIDVDKLSVADLRKYSAAIDLTISSGVARMDTVLNAYKKAKEADRILQKKIQSAKDLLNTLDQNDQLLTKKALATIITKIEQARAQEPDPTQLGYAAVITNAIKEALPIDNSLIAMDNYKKQIGNLAATLESAMKDASSISLTIPQQIDQQPDEETSIALRERFHAKTAPTLNAAKKSLDAYHKDHFNTYAIYVPRETALYREAKQAFDKQRQVIDKFQTTYTPLEEIAIGEESTETHSIWKPSGDLSTAHFATILASAHLLGSPNYNLATLCLPLIAAAGCVFRYQQPTPPENKEESSKTKEALKLLSSAYYASLIGLAYYSKHFLDSVSHDIFKPTSSEGMGTPPGDAPPGWRSIHLFFAGSAAACAILHKAAPWVYKKVTGATPTSLAHLSSKQMEDYARDVERLKGTLISNITVTLDAKYSVDTLISAHNKYEWAKVEAIAQVSRLKHRDHHVEAYRLAYAIYLIDMEIEHWKVGKQENWRSPVTETSQLPKLLEALKKSTTLLESSKEEWDVSNKPSSFTNQLESLSIFEEQISFSQSLKGTITTETIQKPDLEQTIQTLKSKIIASIDAKHREYYAELGSLQQELSTIFSTYAISKPSKKQVANVLQKEIYAFSRPQDTSFETGQGFIFKTKKTIDQMSAEEIIRLKPETIAADLIDASKKRIDTVFPSYKNFVDAHTAYKKALTAAEQTKLEFEKEQKISHAAELNDKIHKIKEEIKQKAKEPIHTETDLNSLSVFLRNQAYNLRSIEGDIQGLPALPASEQIELIDPNGPFANKLMTSLRKEIETTLADNKKKISKSIDSVQKLVETLGCPQAWLAAIKKDLKKHQKAMETAADHLPGTTFDWRGNSSETKISLAKLSTQQLGEVHKNLKAAASPIDDAIESYHISRLQTQHEHYESQIAAVKKHIKTCRQKKHVDAVDRLTKLLSATARKIQDHLHSAPANVQTAMDHFIPFLREATEELYKGLREIQGEEPVSIATLMQTIDPNSQKYRDLKRDLQQKVKKQIDDKNKELKDYQKNLEKIQKLLDGLSGSPIAIPETWRQSLMRNLQEKQSLLGDLVKGLPKLDQGIINGYDLFDTLKSENLLVYETLIEQLAGKPDKLLKSLENRVHLKQVITNLTSWITARTNLSHATTNPYSSDEQKAWLKNCLDANDAMVRHAFESLHNLNDTEFLIKTLDQSESSLLYAYKYKSNAIGDHMDPWCLIYHYESEKKNNPYAAEKDVSGYFKKARESSFDPTVDANHQRHIIDPLNEIIEQSKKFITDMSTFVDTLVQKARDGGADPHSSSFKDLLKTQTALKTNLQEIETLKGSFKTKDKKGKDITLPPEQIKTFDNLMAYRARIYTIAAAAKNQYDSTITDRATTLCSQAMDAATKKADADDDVDTPPNSGLTFKDPAVAGAADPAGPHAAGGAAAPGPHAAGSVAAGPVMAGPPEEEKKKTGTHPSPLPPSGTSSSSSWPAHFPGAPKAPHAASNHQQVVESLDKTVRKNYHSSGENFGEWTLQKLKDNKEIYPKAYREIQQEFQQLDINMEPFRAAATEAYQDLTNALHAPENAHGDGGPQAHEPSPLAQALVRAYTSIIPQQPPGELTINAYMSLCEAVIQTNHIKQTLLDIRRMVTSQVSLEEPKVIDMLGKVNTVEGLNQVKHQCEPHRVFFKGLKDLAKDIGSHIPGVRGLGQTSVIIENILNGLDKTSIDSIAKIQTTFLPTKQALQGLLKQLDKANEQIHDYRDDNQIAKAVQLEGKLKDILATKLLPADNIRTEADLHAAIPTFNETAQAINAALVEVLSKPSDSLASQLHAIPKGHPHSLMLRDPILKEHQAKAQAVLEKCQLIRPNIRQSVSSPLLNSLLSEIETIEMNASKALKNTYSPGWVTRNIPLDKLTDEQFKDYQNATDKVISETNKKLAGLERAIKEREFDATVMLQHAKARFAQLQKLHPTPHIHIAWLDQAIAQLEHIKPPFDNNCLNGEIATLKGFKKMAHKVALARRQCQLATDRAQEAINEPKNRSALAQLRLAEEQQSNGVTITPEAKGAVLKVLDEKHQKILAPATEAVAKSSLALENLPFDKAMIDRLTNEIRKQNSALVKRQIDPDLMNAAQWDAWLKETETVSAQVLSAINALKLGERLHLFTMYQQVKTAVMSCQNLARERQRWDLAAYLQIALRGFDALSGKLAHMSLNDYWTEFQQLQKALDIAYQQTTKEVVRGNYCPVEDQINYLKTKHPKECQYLEDYAALLQMQAQPHLAPPPPGPRPPPVVVD